MTTSPLLPLIERYTSDPESVYNTWFVSGAERMKAFRTIRRGVRDVVDAVSAGTFGNDFKGSPLSPLRICAPIVTPSVASRRITRRCRSLRVAGVLGLRKAVGDRRPGLEDPRAQTMTQPAAAPSRRRPVLGFAIGFLLVLVVATVGYLAQRGAAGSAADPTNATSVAEGRQVYATFCASCHGANLEGQPNWKERLPSGLLPAPPHDASGHTWHHPDRLLYDIVIQGSAAYLPAGETGGMPAYQNVLTEEQIWAVLAYIKNTWPPDVLQAQERANQQVR